MNAEIIGALCCWIMGPAAPPGAVRIAPAAARGGDTVRSRRSMTGVSFKY